MATGLRTLRNLPPADRALLLEAAALVIGLRVTVRLVRFRVVQRWLQRWGHRTPRVCRSRASIQWAVQAAGRRIPGTMCLVEALAASAMLRRHGHAATLKIGVRPGGGVRLDAHAWVESDGTVVVGTTRAMGEYSVLLEEPG